MKKPKLNLLLFLLMFPAIFNLKAQEPLTLLTIQQSVDLAIKNNAEINQLRAQLKQKEQSWRTMTGISAPEISYFKEGINSNEIKPFNEQRYTISQTVDFPLTTIYRIKFVNEEKAALEYRIQAAEREIKSTVKAKYVEVLYGLHLKKLRQQQITLAKDLYNAVFSKFETGMGNGIDLINAELKVAEAQNDFDESEKIIHTARYGLFNLIGMEPDKQEYSTTFTDSLQTNNIDIDQIEALAVLDKQPAYIAALHDYQAANNQLKEARSNILPDIRFDYYTQDYGSGFNYNGFEVGLSIPIWFPFDQRGNIKIALAKQEEILFKQKSIELEMKEQIERAWHSYESSKATVNRYRETIKTKADKLQSLALEAYRLGEIDMLNLLNSQQVYLNSQQRYLIALRDYFIQLTQLEKYLDQDLVY